MLTKNPISPSVSRRVRFAIGVPTATSCWPEYRLSSTAQPDSNVMNNVTPCSRLNACSCSLSASGSAKRSVLPRKVCSARSRPIRRQRQQRRQILQLLAPVRQLLLQHRSLQPAPLPLRVIGVLDRQRRERRVSLPSRTPDTGSPAHGRRSPATSRPTHCGASSPAARSRSHHLCSLPISRSSRIRHSGSLDRSKQ